MKNFYNKDIRNSTKSLLDADGDGIIAYDYSDFGETMITGNQDVGNEVAYTGGIYDKSTGLYYLNARYYDPEDGRFLTEDTYRGETNDPDTWHLYAYCNNDPVNYVDPSGHSSSPYVYEMIYGTYWYYKYCKTKFGVKGGYAEYAKKSSDTHLKKYRKAIDDERKYANKAQKAFGKAALLAIIDYGTFKFGGLIEGLKISKKIPKYILNKISGTLINGINKSASAIVGANFLKSSRDGLSKLQSAVKQHKKIKKEYKKIKRK